MFIMKLFISAFFLFFAFTIKAQQNTNIISRPKIVIGIVIDQMRWDYLYRYYDRYKANGGFRRMLDRGMSCDNTMIPYTPTVTACGHSCIYTGSVPAINGITGNEWWDRTTEKKMYCANDNTVKPIGSDNKMNELSPKNLLTTTIGDQMGFACNYTNKVIGIALKDRGAILPAGHSAKAAYWYDSKSGNFISSNFYFNELPKWVNDFNARKLPDTYYAQNWNTLYPINTYLQSTADDRPYEDKLFGKTTRAGFPYMLDSFIGKNYSKLWHTPYGNTLTFEMAKAAIINEKMGKGTFTDLLAVSFSTPDIIGHAVGPNAIATEDCYLRLDIELGKFFDFLDLQFGRGNYTSFLSADHGVAEVPGFNEDHKLPGKPWDDVKLAEKLNAACKVKFGIEKTVISMANYQVAIDPKVISETNTRDAIVTFMLPIIEKEPGIARVFDIQKLSETTLPDVQKKMLENGYYPKRSGDVQIILEPGWIDMGDKGTTHGLWNPYDAHIPLLWYGFGIKPGKLSREVYMTDIAPTLASLLRIQMPSGSIGHVIPEVLK
jgi:predicted AlkP superfamily pyrophosphatase or phosphodiesterase